MTDFATLSPALLLPALSFLGGLPLGYAYFRALRLTVDLVVGGRAPLLGLALTLVRVAMLGGGLFLAVLGGAWSLLAALAGVLVAKKFAVLRTGKAVA